MTRSLFQMSHFRFWPEAQAVPPLGILIHGAFVILNDIQDVSPSPPISDCPPSVCSPQPVRFGDLAHVLTQVPQPLKTWISTSQSVLQEISTLVPCAVHGHSAQN